MAGRLEVELGIIRISHMQEKGLCYMATVVFAGLTASPAHYPIANIAPARNIMLTRKMPNLKKEPINRYSLKKIEELNAEAPIRRTLCCRAHGIPVETVEVVYRNGTKHTINRVKCINGICQCGCSQCSPILHPHEKHSRGRGGKLTLENSIMVSDNHHAVLQNNLPKWSKP